VHLHLDYRYAPGSTVDGATLELGEDDIAALDCERIERIVPGWLPEMVGVLIEQLPKDVRRRLIPLADSAQALAAVVARDDRPLTTALAMAVEDRLGADRRREPVTPAAFATASLPAHLRLRFRIRDAAGTLIYEGRDPAFIATQAAAASDRLLPLKAQYDTVPSASWPGDCPGEVRLHGVTGHVALSRARDERGLPAARRTVYASAVSAAAWHDDGLDALLEAALAPELERIALAEAPPVLAGRCERLLGARLGALRRGLALAVLRSVERRRIVDRTAWVDLRDRAAALLPREAASFDTLLDRCAGRVETLRTRLKQGAKNLVAVQVQRSVARHLERLTGPGWTSRLPWSGLRRLDTFLDALVRLLDGCAARPADMQRAAARREALMDTWDQAVDEGHRRLAEALGCVPRLRELAAQGEECLLAADGSASGASAAGAGFTEGRWRAALTQLAERLATATDRIAQVRDRLIEAHTITARLPPGRVRERLQGDCARLAREFPDLGLGCDCDAQIIAAQALMDRVKTAVAAVR
jgi:hypothetical protein